MRNTRPTPHRVLDAIQSFDSDLRYGVADRALGQLFAAFPSNRHLEHVYLKCVALNALYRTNVYAVLALAQNIANAKLDNHLRRGSAMAVELIKELTVAGKTRSTYSFATKYCSWHQPEAFVIYDGRVDATLRHFRRLDRFSSFQNDELRDYARFRSIVDAFRQHYSLEQFSYKQIDKYLWWFGRQLG